MKKLRLSRGKASNVLDDVNDLNNPSAKSNGYINCIIVNEPLTLVEYKSVKKENIPTDSIPVIDNNEVTHLLNWDGKALTPILYLPPENTDKTPEDCFEATCWGELTRILGVGLAGIEKIKLGIFIALAVGLVVVLFLLSSIAMG